MWLSERAAKNSIERPTHADTGKATSVGEGVNVFSQLEYRNVPIVTPGGFLWRPAVGEELTVIKCGPGEMPCVIGKSGSSGNIESGEVMLFSKGAVLKLKNNGDIEITGNIKLKGNLTVSGDLSVDGETTMNGTANANSTMNANSQLFINGALCALCVAGPPDAEE